MSKIKNQPFVPEIKYRSGVQNKNPKDKPLASKSINRPQLSKSRYLLLKSLIKYRPLISKIKDRSQVFQSIKRVQSKRWANTVQKKKKQPLVAKIINRPRVFKSKDRLLNSKIKKNRPLISKSNNGPLVSKIKIGHQCPKSKMCSLRLEMTKL